MGLWAACLLGHWINSETTITILSPMIRKTVHLWLYWLCDFFCCFFQSSVHQWARSVCLPGVFCVCRTVPLLNIQGLWPTDSWNGFSSWSGMMETMAHRSVHTHTHVCMCSVYIPSLLMLPHQMMPYLVVDILTGYPGLPGLFFAAVCSGSLRFLLKLFLSWTTSQA